MTQFTTALSSLLPAAGAIALTVHGASRMARTSNRAAPAAPPQPREPLPTPRKPHRQSQPDGTCATCGTSIPARDAHCAFCARALTGAEESLWATAAHWLVFVGVTAVIIGAGWLMLP